MHSDGGKEFVASQVVEQLSEETVWKTCSSAYDPQVNGRAERQVQSIKERATSLLLHADMPRSFWPYAVKQATYELRLSAIVKDPPFGMPLSVIPLVFVFRGQSLLPLECEKECFYVWRNPCRMDPKSLWTRRPGPRS